MNSKICHCGLFCYICIKIYTMNRFWVFFVFVVVSAKSFADNIQLLNELDSTLEQREGYVKAKEDRIAYLKRSINSERDHVFVLKTLDALYEEYHVFKLDSAMVYTKKGMEIAEKENNGYFITLFTIHKAEILTLGGLYSEAVDQLNSIRGSNIEQKLLFKYYYTYFSVYSYWSDYSNDPVFSPLYRQKANDYLKQAMRFADENDPLFQFYLGEQNVYVDPDRKKAREYYLGILNTTGQNSRIYAMASFALAGNFRMSGDEEKYEEYLIRAALSDLKSCTMENLALQTLAVKLFEKGEDYLERAERYISISMEDAKFYNNRLRILEISRNLPQIMNAYQASIETKNRNLRHSVIFISLLMLGLLFTAYFIYRQNRKLALRRKELAENNKQLSYLNEQLAESNQHQIGLNEQLKGLNQKLVDTNKRRESLASIFIDLCAKYIDKMGKYQTLVKRKIKANQAQELLQNISSTRISEEDASTFLHRFDKAFLELYPTFVGEFNALLRPEERIIQKSSHALTTDLRTFALIRLGVKNTADIAGLLFLSNQTIYNCRSVTKSKAISKDSFDDDVMRLCTVIS